MHSLQRYEKKDPSFSTLFEAGKCLEYANYEDINDYFLIDEEDDEIETEPDDDDKKDIPTDPDVISGWIWTVGKQVFAFSLVTFFLK